MIMDALDFLREYNRMCSVNKDCSGCPLKGTDCSLNRELSEEQMTFIVDGTEKWSKEHPLVTNEMKVREVFGDNAVNSILVLPPSDIKRWLAEPYKERTK